MDLNDIKTTDFDYDLPEELIAQTPLKDRKTSRMMVLHIPTGEYEHKLDAKGRLIMPLKLRSELGESFMVTKGIDCCLYVYGMTEWEEFVEKLNKLPMTNRTARAFKRGFLAGAVKCEPDAQGRILLSPKQRE